MKKLVQTVNRPFVLVTALLTAFAVIVAKVFMTKDPDDQD